MKAKEYASLYKEKKEKEGQEKALYNILMLFLNEVAEIGKSRVPSGKVSESVLRSILKEQSAKWCAFARFTEEGIKEDGFINFLRAKMPYLPLD